MVYEIYKHTNKTNNKCYIGLTAIGMHNRWLMHRKKANYTVRRQHGNYFHRALVKYDSKCWDHEVLETVPTLQEAELAEIKWIAHFKSNLKEFGYNLTTGGNAGITFLNEEIKRRIAEKVTKIMADPARRLLSSQTAKKYNAEFGNIFKGKKHSDLVKSILSKKSKAYQEVHGNPFLGKVHSEETRIKMSATAKKRCADPNWKPPVLINGITDETRKKMSDAKKGTHPGKITKEMILEACQGCKTQKEVSDKLKCTTANISFLIRSFNIIDEVQTLLGNKSPTKEDYLELAKTCRSQQEMALKLNCSSANIGIMLKKYEIKDEVKKLLKNQK